MKILRLIGLPLCTLLIISTFMSTFTACSTSAPAEEITLRFTMYFPVDSYQAKVGEAWYKEIENRTNGQVKFLYYPGGTLMEGPATTDGVKNGVVDVGYMTIGHVSGRFPVMECMTQMTGFSSAFITGHVADDFYNQFKPKEWDDFVVLAPGGNSAFVTFSTKPVNTLADFEGLKIRAPGNTGKQVQALGASAISIPMGDAFDSLTKGVIDGASCAMEAAKTWRLGEACQYLVQTSQAISPAVYLLIMNKESYDRLTPEIQEVFMEVSAEYVDKFALAWNDADMEAWEYCEEMNINVLDLTAAEMDKCMESMDPLKAQYVQNMVGLGYTESEVNSWFDFLQTRIDYWLQQQIQRGIKSPVGPAEIRIP